MVSGLKFELSSRFRSGSGGINVKRYNEVVNVIGSKVGIVEGDTNNMLNIKEDIGDGYPSVLCSKDIVSYSDGC